MAANLGDFTKQIDKILDEYTKDVTENLESGLDESQEYLVEQLKAASPRSTGINEGDHYADHWHAGTSGKGYRRVVNDKTVPWNGKQQSLAGILEYSHKHSKKHIEETRRKSRRKILQILKDSIAKGA